MIQFLLSETEEILSLKSAKIEITAFHREIPKHHSLQANYIRFVSFISCVNINNNDTIFTV